MRKFLVLAIIALFLAPCFAIDFKASALVPKINEKKMAINQAIENGRIPYYIKRVFSDETINVQLKMNNGKIEKLGIKSGGGKLVEAIINGYSEYTMNVFVSEKTASEIYSSKNPVKDAIAAYNSGKIKVDYPMPVQAVANAIQKGDIATAGTNILKYVGFGLFNFFNRVTGSFSMALFGDGEE